MIAIVFWSFCFLTFLLAILVWIARHPIGALPLIAAGAFGVAAILLGFNGAIYAASIAVSGLCAWLMLSLRWRQRMTAALGVQIR